MQTAVLFVFVACCALSALSLADDTEDFRPPGSLSPAEQFSPTAGSSTTMAPTPGHNITTPAPTTPAPTTPAPTTHAPTTHAPTTHTPTTHAPTTHNTTTHAPTTKSTTTTHAPPAPTPSTSIPTGSYNLTNPKDKKINCLMAQMGLRIRLETKEANGTFIVQPNKTTPLGFCAETNANLTLSFDEGFITFLFNKSVANNIAYVDALSFNVSFKGGNAARTAKNESIQLFAAKIGHYYSCKNESLYMGKGLYLDVSQDKIQAFNVTSNSFGVPDNCPADEPSYRVAIAVGVTLLVLILVVVVAYLLGRKKRTDGYQSL